MSGEDEKKRRRKDRNRRRSKRRAIYCPIHGYYLDSASQKYSLYADKSEQLQERGMSKRKARTVIASHKTVLLSREWLESFWCEDCQAKKWYHISRNRAGSYVVSVAPRELWQQVEGVRASNGNPSVSEYTLRQSRACYSF